MKNKQLIEIVESLPLFASNFLSIRTKSGEIRKFELNKAQFYLHERLETQLKETGKVRALILKGRQMGSSTYVQARYFHKVITQEGKKAFILTHEAEATKNLFDMTKRYYEGLPDGLAPKSDASNARELNFKSLNSGYSVGTAGNKAVGRSQTIQLMHACLCENTLIYDPILQVAKSMKHFSVGDFVLTHTLKIAPISYISSQIKSCLELKLRTLTAFPLIGTKEHRFWTKSGWKNLECLKINDEIGFPVKEITGLTGSWILPDNNIRKDGGGRHFKAPKEINLDYDFGLIVGLYLAEGHSKPQYEYPKNMCNVSFTIHRNEKDRTLKWLEPLKEYYSSVTVKDRENCLTTEINVYGTQFASLINNYCGRTTGKHFPYQWSSMPVEFCRGMIHGYISGDGGSYDSSRRIVVSSICMSLIVQLRDLCASLNYGWGSIAEKVAARRHGRNERHRYTFSLCSYGASKMADEINKPSPERRRDVINGSSVNTAKTTEISNGYAWLRIRSIKDVGDKQVYDFEVDHEDHSYCTIHGASHNSEAAYYPHAEEHAKGILQAVSNEDGTEIIMESTANGIGNYFYNMWMSATSGQSDFQAIFVPWFWQPEYTSHLKEGESSLSDEEHNLLQEHGSSGLTPEHLYWRRRKLLEFSNDYETGRELFNVEYPFTALDAFRNPVADRFIHVHLVNKARKGNVDSSSPLVIGVDPAISDHDRTAIVRRKGRLAYNLETHFNLNTMETVGLIRRIIDKERPAKVCIDCIGIGAGIVDRLLEIGYEQVEGVNVARSANDKDKFRNLRAELWHDMREWLAQESPVQIPDSDELLGDLTSLGYKFDSSGRLLIESKEDLKKRGMKSPDCFVAGTMIDTPRGKIAIELLTVGDLVETPMGARRIIKNWQSNTETITTVKFSNGVIIKGKPSHKIFTWNKGWVTMDALTLTDEVECNSWLKKIRWKFLNILNTREENTDFKRQVDIISQEGKLTPKGFYIEKSGLTILALFKKTMTFITEMATGLITGLKTSNHSIVLATGENTCLSLCPSQNSEKERLLDKRKQLLQQKNGIDLKTGLNGIPNTEKTHGLTEKKLKLNALYAIKNLKHSLQAESQQDFAQESASNQAVIQDKKQSYKSVCGAIKSFWRTNIAKLNVVPKHVQTESVQPTKVYNLTLESENVYYANGILVANCADALALTFAVGDYLQASGFTQNRISPNAAGMFI